jgi:hypothetical protein
MAATSSFESSPVPKLLHLRHLPPCPVRKGYGFKEDIDSLDVTHVGTFNHANAAIPDKGLASSQFISF